MWRRTATAVASRTILRPWSCRAAAGLTAGPSLRLRARACARPAAAELLAYHADVAALPTSVKDTCVNALATKEFVVNIMSDWAVEAQNYTW
jgi:hypothetical protein